MKALKNNLPVILLTLFEFAVGVMLLVNPDAFTKAVLITFGAVLVVIGVIYLVRVLRDQTEGHSAITLIFAIASLVAGLFFIIFPSIVKSLMALVAIIYGAILIISGVYKAKSYSDAKKAGTAVPVVSLVSAVLSVIFGVVIIINPFGNILLKVAGFALIFEAILDLISVILNTGSKKPKDEE